MNDKLALSSSPIEPGPCAVAEEGPGDVTALLQTWRHSPLAAERLLHIVYPQLRRLAASRLAAEAGEESLAASDLAQEVLLRLVGQRRSQYANRRHFFAVAARLLRRIVVDRARRRRTERHGGAFQRVELEPAMAEASGASPDLLALDRALRELARLDPQAVRLVELRYFAGLSVEETAAALGIGRSSVVRGWRWARAWLERRLAVGVEGL